MRQRSKETALRSVNIRCLRKAFKRRKHNNAPMKKGRGSKR
jgi:hypothetical protein